jgi:hypothetical protein
MIIMVMMKTRKIKNCDTIDSIAQKERLEKQKG